MGRLLDDLKHFKSERRFRYEYLNERPENYKLLRQLSISSIFTTQHLYEVQREFRLTDDQLKSQVSYCMKYGFTNIKETLYFLKNIAMKKGFPDYDRSKLPPPQRPKKLIDLFIRGKEITVVSYRMVSPDKLLIELNEEDQKHIQKIRE